MSYSYYSRFSGVGHVDVSNFLLEGGDGCDINMLKATFWEDDVNCIQQIPIGCPGSIDMRRWYYSKNGYYSVRSWLPAIIISMYFAESWDWFMHVRQVLDRDQFR